MGDAEILRLWKEYDRKLEESLQLNKRNAEDLTKLKVLSFLSSLKPIKLFTLAAGILWVGLGSVIVINLAIHAFEKVSLFFLVSAGIQLLLTAVALAVYLYQLILIREVDISEPIVKTQEHLTRLRSTTLWVARILFLQIPLWTTFYLSESMFVSGNVLYLSVNGLITLLFTCVSIWLFVNIKFENRNKKWFRLIFDGREWTPLMKSMELLEQVKEYRA